VNIVIHGVNAISFELIAIILRNSAKRNNLPASSMPFISTSAALLFLVHPLQTESVTYIVQRFTSLSATFYLLTVIAHFQAAVTVDRRTAQAWGILYRFAVTGHVDEGSPVHRSFGACPTGLACLWMQKENLPTATSEWYAMVS